ncbi:MAG: L-threonylcarbamoyladenylate synthase [Nitrososphaeraceae archaeon]
MDNTTGGYLNFKCGEDNGVENCAKIVKDGGIIVYPTDTVYAMGCNPFNDKAVERIFLLKRRVAEKAMPVLCASLLDVENIVEVSNKVKRLARSFWPGPLTIICPLSNRKISPRLTANSSSLAVRIPGNLCTLSLLKLSRYLVGTSANISGRESVKNPSQISTTSLTNFDALLDGGTLIKYSHSTIIQLDDDETLTVVRNGPITERDIIAALRSGS